MNTYSQQQQTGAAPLPHVQEVLRSAQEELTGLLHQRTQILKRIGMVKQVLAGLASLFGDSVLSDELRDLIEERPSMRLRGFTVACRQILMNSRAPVCVQYCTEEMQRRFPELAERHKDLAASVNTVLHRLASYGEARCFLDQNRERVWEWIVDDDRNLRGNAGGLQPTSAA